MNKLLKASVGTATVAFVALGVQTEAKALLIGDSVRGQVSIPIGIPSLEIFTSLLGIKIPIFDQTATVNEGIEFTSPSGRALLDVSSDFFEITFLADGYSSTGLPLTWTLSDLDWAGTPGGITSVSLVSGSESLISGLSFTDNSITVNFFTVTFPPEVQSWKFAVNSNNLTAVPTPASVPTPTAVLPVLGSLFATARRKKNGEEA